jgi:hypothetical protein
MTIALFFQKVAEIDIGIDPLRGRTQPRLVEVAVTGDPASNARVVHLGQLLQRLVAAMMKQPTPNRSADGRQRFRTGGGREVVGRLSIPDRRPASKLKTQKSNEMIGKSPRRFASCNRRCSPVPHRGNQNRVTRDLDITVPPIFQRDIAHARHVDPLIDVAVHVERALSTDIEDVNRTGKLRPGQTSAARRRPPLARVLPASNPRARKRSSTRRVRRRRFALGGFRRSADR